MISFWFWMVLFFVLKTVSCLESCWKCCMFGDYFGSCQGPLCQCNQGQFCFNDYECGDGLYCSRPEQICTSCLDCPGEGCRGRCRGANRSMSVDEVYKRFLGLDLSLANRHSFYWNCSRAFNTVNRIGCPCNKNLNISCVTGATCIKGIYGGGDPAGSNDIILTGRVVTGVCQACPKGYVCNDGYTTIECKDGYYCPGNGSEMIMCPAGYYCNNRSTRPEPCRYAGVYSGNICKEGSSVGNTLCQGGYYCPNTSTELPCPQGTFCRGQNVQPKKCPLLTTCDTGSIVPNGPSGYVWIVVGFVILVGFIIKSGMLGWLWKKFKKRRADDKNSIIIDIKEDEERVRIEEIHYQDLHVGTWLANNSGVLKGGKVNAIMGSSGCGKSTLIELIRGRIEERDLAGGTVSVRFNSGDVLEYDVTENSKQLGDLRKTIGFVPQDDLVFGDLTVRENLWYSCKLKGGGKSAEDRVHKVLNELGLAKIADKIVGSVGKRGVSGGQKKRVNIGMELVGLHPLIFMDEPTSGLDSTGSYEVLKFLGKLSDQYGITFVCVVHQPRFSSFMLFDHLVLLGKNGCVFMGSTSSSLAYFSLGLGASINHNDNPGDAIMDMITYGFHSKEGGHVNASDLNRLWIEKGIHWIDEFNKTCGEDMLKDCVFRYDDKIESIIDEKEVYSAYDLIKFFEEYGGGIGISHQDAKRFIGNNMMMIKASEFKHRWKEVCSRRALLEGGNTWLSVIESILSIIAPRNILFDASIDRWKKMRIDSLVLRFINKLRKRKGNDWVGSGEDVLDKEILYTTLRIKRACVDMILSRGCSRSDIKKRMYDGRLFKQGCVLIRRRWISFARSPWFVQLCVTMAAALIVGAIHGADWDIGGFNGNIVMAMA